MVAFQAPEHICVKNICDWGRRTCRGGGRGSHPSVMWLLAGGRGKGHRAGSEPCSLPPRLNTWASSRGG